MRMDLLIIVKWLDLIQWQQVSPYNNKIIVTSLLQYILDPSIQSLSSTRTDTNEFNIIINFNYLGANNISSITIGYRPINLTL